MSKAILIMDMPEICYECPLCTEEDSCLAVGNDSIEVDTVKGKPDWCPLVAVPDKLPYSDTKGIAMASYIEGWNDCIKKLTEDTNG